MTQALGALCPAWGLSADWFLALLELGVSWYLIESLPLRRTSPVLSGTWGAYSYIFTPISELCYEIKRTSDLPVFSEPASVCGGVWVKSRALSWDHPGRPFTVFITLHRSKKRKRLL